jgi:uncharacterized membrane protein YraQ (UPF0718 family)
LNAVGVSFAHNWKVLALSILIAVGLKTYVNSDKLSSLLFRRKKISIFASVLFGAFTPFCACGTTAVIIGMLTTALPWGPIMAFLTSSPLMSPDGFVMISGVIGIDFAVALTLASLGIGILSGFITNIIEKKTEFLESQSRFLGNIRANACTCSKTSKTPACSCSAPTSAASCSAAANTASCTCSSTDQGKSDDILSGEIMISRQSDQLCCSTADKGSKSIDFIRKLKLREFTKGLFDLGIRQILLFYSIFIAIGYMINYFIPTSIITVLFGAKSIFAVPLASLIGLPLYITTESGIPIVQSMIQSGASEGAMLAFMITGSATSAWVIAGVSTFMKKRAIALYVIFVLIGGILSGYLYDFINMLVR